MNAVKIKVILITVAICVAACSKVAVTGRKQLALVSNSEIMPLSFSQYDQVLKESNVIKGTAEAEMVNRVGVKIQKAVETYMSQNGHASELKGFNWDFNLIKDDNMVNAWCMPGGKVAFYTGIMPICKDEKGVAVVMGHEVAHAIAHHGRERMSQGMVANLGLTSLGAAMSQNPTMTKQLMMQAIGMGTQVGMLKFSRTHESEADRMGLIFMAMAGYNPNEAPLFWQRMAAKSGGQAPPEFLSTHPSNARRISDLKRQMPEAMKYYKK